MLTPPFLSGRTRFTSKQTNIKKQWNCGSFAVICCIKTQVHWQLLNLCPPTNILTGNICALSCGKIQFFDTPDASFCPSLSSSNDNTFKIYVFIRKKQDGGWSFRCPFNTFVCEKNLFFFFCRCEIEATLERLKKLERDLSTKEQELKEREQRLKMWERKLIEQSSSPVSPSLVLLHLDASSHACLPEAVRRTSAEVGRKSVEVKGRMRRTQEQPRSVCVVGSS